jgi:hypothetical protein
MDGHRDLKLERGLSGLENAFATIRREKLEIRAQLEPEEHFLLCVFIAASHARTPAQREHWRDQWGKVLERMDHMTKWMSTATEAQKKRMAGVPTLSSKKGKSLSHSQVREMVEAPMQTLLYPQIKTEAPLLATLDLAVIEADAADEVGFITSDRPCVWFDPEGYKRPPIYRHAALCYRSIEITFPISPRQCILLNRVGVSGYRLAQDELVQHLNRRTRFFADDHFVVCRNRTNSIWFDPGVEPDDSWEKVHAIEEEE